VVCHEHVGAPRRWSDEEQSFAVSVGAVISSLLETRARREAERRLTELADDVAAAKQLARARGEILAVVGHDLRGPLASIHTTASLLALDAPPEAETTHRRLARIQRSVRFMERLITDLVDASRLEAGHALSVQPTPQRIDALVTEALELVRDHARARSLELGAELGAGDLELLCDRDRVLQALSNLLGNAVKFTPTGSRVGVSTARRDDGGVRITVEDEGPGIAAEDLPHVFERYWHGAAGHTGLGLYIVKAVVDAHHGSIRVQSREGHGTTFVIELPAPPA
jgi:signal transduction histidine kinase